MNVDNNTFLVARPLTGAKLTPIYSTDNKTIAISWFRWANDERLIDWLSDDTEHIMVLADFGCTAPTSGRCHSGRAS